MLLTYDTSVMFMLNLLPICTVIGFCPSLNDLVTSRALYRENFTSMEIEELRGVAKVLPTDLEWGDWQRLLSREQFQVARMKCNENPFTSPLTKTSEKGIFSCTSCGSNLFLSQSKYSSGYGWPAFYHPIRPDLVIKRKDKCKPPPGWFPKFSRLEVGCSKCGAHLGHEFNISSKPDGIRYFINGLALDFTRK